MRLHDDLLKELEALGETPADVAATLKSKGIKGSKYNPYDCPIAAYLTTCGYAGCAVGQDEMMLRDGTVIPTPGTIYQFVWNFDHSTYPDLIRGLT